MKAKRVEILLHDIEWWYEGFSPKELPESEVEHIKSMIINGCREGELCCGEKEKRGWWRIVKD